MHDNSIIVGEWKDDKLEEKAMTYLSDGTRLEANYINDRAEGNGKYFYTNNFKDNKPFGRGLMFCPDGKVKETQS